MPYIYGAFIAYALVDYMYPWTTFHRCFKFDQTAWMEKIN